ncbi:hypothetical protein BDF19DRAFT_430734 [Syncephalis fuscata]|nr:hypothetical protein BDF19DRAFT_430734 [Syncephalis fuscata]
MCVDMLRKKYLNITVYGARGVGKTSLLRQLPLDMTLSRAGTATTATGYYRHVQWTEGQPMVVSVMDTGSPTLFEAMANLHRTIGDAVILIPIVLMGTKADLEQDRKVPIADGMAQATLWDCPFFETAATQSSSAILDAITVLTETSLGITTWAPYPPSLSYSPTSMRFRMKKSRFKTRAQRYFTACHKLVTHWRGTATN